MATTAPEPELPPPFPRRLTRWALALLLLIGAVMAIPFAIDTAPGRAWLARQLPGLVLENGLSFRVERIDGSLWRGLRLTGIAIHDQDGRFATIDRLALDWTPLALAWNQFEADTLDIGTARLARWPRLKPTRDPRLLPAQDIIIRRLRVRRLELAQGMAGLQRLITANGGLDIRAGRAVLALDARALGAAGGDRLRINLDAEPDRDRFALDAQLAAPAGGVVTSLAGLSQPLAVSATGRGRWRAWDGTLRAGLASRPGALADVALSGRDGRLSARGRIDPIPLLAKGTLTELLAGGLALDAEATPQGDAVRFAMVLEGKGLTASGSGALDRASERLSDTRVQFALADAAALAQHAGVAGLAASARLNGPLLAPAIDARITARSLTLPGAITLEGLSLAGIADLNEQPPAAPLALTVARISGLPDTLAPLAAGGRGEGRLRWQAGELKGDAITLRFGPVSTRIGFGWRPATGGWAVDAAGEARAWPLPGLNASDAAFTARLRPAPGGGAAGTGDIRLIAVRPADAVTRLTGGNLALSGRFALAAGGVVTLSDLALSSPKLAAGGSAGWRAGQFTLSASGRSRDWGSFTLDGRGTPASPHLAARLASPGYGITAATLALDPAGNGWRLTGEAQSGIGPVRLAAGIGIDPVLSLDIERLEAGDLSARGRITQTSAGPFAGTLQLAGAGLAGKAVLAADGGVQQAVFDLAGSSVSLPLATPVTIDRLSLAGSLLLPPGGPTLAAKLVLSGLERGSLVLEKAEALLALRDGKGSASLSVAGTSDAPFHLALQAAIAPDRYEISGDGDYDGRRARLGGPAIITRDAAGWHLAPTTLASGMGNATLEGDWGDRRHIIARLDKVSLGLVTLAWPSIDLAGRLSGDVALDWPQGGAPTGRVALMLNGLSRSNAASTSTPIDVGLNAALGTGGSSLKAQIVRAGKVEGRIQARLGPVPAGETPLLERLFQAAVVGQLRYAGPAQDLWGLAGITALDVRGPAQVAADLSGTLGDPRVAGRLKASGGRVEAPLLGAVVSDASLDARFSASRLELLRFAGRSGQGSISGSGSIDLSWERGFPMDIRLQVKDAAILGRDDLTAAGSGNIRLATDEYGGVVSGTLALSRAEYRVGRTAVADVPVLPVTEKNSRLIGRRAVQYVAPTRWLYNLAIKADNRLKVTGMGINSEWQADVRLRGAATAPELFGRVQLVRGDYDFAGKRFQLTRGDIRFVGGYPPDPIIAVTAENSGNGFTALLNIDGTAQKPQIKFSSVPALPEDEVLSRVLFGSRVTDLSAPEAIQLAGALASLRGGGGGFNPIGMVSKGLGIDRLRILPADTVTGRRTTVAAGQYLGRNVYVELATDAQGYTATSIEIGLTRSLSVLSSVATLGGTSAGVRWKKDY